MTNWRPCRSASSIGCLILFSTAVILAARPLAAEEPHESSSPPFITSATVKGWLEQGSPVTFLDVREPDEFAAGHLPEALNMGWTEVAAIAPQLPHDQPIVVYCIHSAHRAPEAAKTLRALGFDNAYVLEGGIVAWQAGGAMILASNPTHLPTVLPKTDRCDKVGSP